MSLRCYLGVDGGGTQTRAVLADEAGRVHRSAQAGSANRNHHSRDEVRRTLQALFQETLTGLPSGSALSALFLGMSGISTEADRQELRGILHEIPEIGSEVRVGVENDTLAGLTGGLSGRPGLALIAGTGSACFGRSADGTHLLCGGWGALADDIGSAPWIGLQALRAAVRAEDGRQLPTALQGIVFEFLGLGEPRQLIRRVHNHGLERADLGRIAPLVAAAAQSGDAAAESILREAASGLSEMVRVTAHRLFGQSPCEMILVGGLALSGPPFQPMLIERIHRDCPPVLIRDPELPPALGAVLLAMQSGGVSWTPLLFADLALDN